MRSGFVAAGQGSAAGVATGGERRRARKERRAPHRVPCRVRWHDPASGEAIACVGETINVSARGLAVRLGHEVPVGTWVETLLPHMNGDPTFVCGSVLHCQRVLTATFEVGIEFVSDWHPEICWERGR